MISPRAGLKSDLTVHTPRKPGACSSSVKRMLRKFYLDGFQKRILRGGRFDLLHIHCPFGGCEDWSDIRHDKLVVSWWRQHSLPDGSPSFGGIWGKEHLQRAAAVTVPYSFLYDRIREAVPGIKHLEVIPTGIDPARFEGFSTRAARGDSFNFCFARPIEPRWGPDRALEAFMRLAEGVPEARLVMLGEGEEKYVSGLKRLARSKGLHNRIHITGRVTEAEYLAVLRESQVFLHPFREEGFATGLLEAMAAGLPVVATASESIAEVVIDDATGLICPQDDIASLSKAMLEMVHNPVLRLKLGHNARELALKLYSFDMHAERMSGLYTEVVEGKLSSRALRKQAPGA